jgi:dTDP-glucose 4,6-dehydratase/UDP-glucose 4-epimerase
MRPPEPLVEAIDRRFGEGREALRGARLFVTGGTGFFGRWLLDYLAHVHDRYDIHLGVTVLTRDRLAFARAHHGVAHLLDHPAIRFVEGDVRDFDYPDGRFSHVIHGAHTTARATFNRENPLIQFDTACVGARRVLDFAVQTCARRFLMLSSGSVYSASPAVLTRIPEDFAGAPLTYDVSAALNHGKRAAEFQCAYYGQRNGLKTVIARCFSFVGPGLPLDIHYAVGNFIRDALWGDAVVVNGDGSPVRSYLDVGDWVVWSLAMLTRAPSGAVYNVGSDVAISILELATRVRDLLAPDKPIIVLAANTGKVNRNIYVPNISRAREDLQLDIWTPLDESIRSMAEFALAARGH